MLSWWWRNLGILWASTDKGPLLFVAILALVVAGSVYFTYTSYADEVDHRNLTCLALNVYFEARGESRAGQHAVAEVTMNRVTARQYPKTVCGVVYQKNWDPSRKRFVAAFSWTELESWPYPSGEPWRRAWAIAEDVYYRRQPSTLDGALLFHSVNIAPSWSRGRTPVARIGKHVFYK